METFDTDLARVREEAGIRDVPVERRNIQRMAVANSVYDGRPDWSGGPARIAATDLELYGY